RRLRGNALGLRPWDSTELVGNDGLRVRITATPAQHGPFLFRSAVGAVIGFVLEWDGQDFGGLYISGDTVWFGGIKQIPERFKIGTAILHIGGARFPLYGPLRFTFDGAEGARATRELGARTVIPIHYEGWEHFKESRENTERAFEQSGLSD